MSNGKVTVLSCALVGNVGAGVDANGATPQVLVSNSNVSFNGTGIHTDGTALVRITHNDIFSNTSLAWDIVGSSHIETYADNRVLGTGNGTLTDVP